MTKRIENSKRTLTKKIYEALKLGIDVKRTNAYLFAENGDKEVIRDAIRTFKVVKIGFENNKNND